MVKLRLRRTGRKKAPMYKIVASDSRAPRDGRFIESVGTYNPGVNPAVVDVKEDRVFHWLNNGATPTNTVKNLLSRKGIMLKLHLNKKGADAAKITEEHAKWSSMQEAKLQKEHDKKVNRKAKKKKAEAAAKEPAAVETPVPAEG